MAIGFKSDAQAEQLLIFAHGSLQQGHQVLLLPRQMFQGGRQVRRNLLHSPQDHLYAENGLVAQVPGVLGGPADDALLGGLITIDGGAKEDDRHTGEDQKDELGGQASIFYRHWRNRDKTRKNWE